MLNPVFLSNLNLSKIDNICSDPCYTMAGLKFSFVLFQLFGTLPYAKFVRGTLVPDDHGGNATHRYKDYWGYEVKMLEELGRVLDFTYEFVNPPDSSWGLINETGQWTGLTGMASEGEVTAVVCEIVAGSHFEGFQAC